MLFSKATVLALVAAATAAPVSPWEAIHDERECAARGYSWGSDRRCVEHREERQDRREEWRDFRDERECASHGYRWDVRHGCGPLSGVYARDEKVSPWEAIHDERVCAERGYSWGADRRCVERKEARQDYRDAWSGYTSPFACAQHGFRWDERHGCGPLTGLAGSLPRPYKRDTEVSPWEAFHDEQSCARNHFFWNEGRCVERKEEHQDAREDYHNFRDQRECASHGFRWDERHGCGPLAKREVETTEQYPPWRPGPWDSWRDRNECERHAYRWDVVSGRCAELAGAVAASAVGNVAGAIANGVSALTGGIVGAVNQYNTEQECLAHSARWDREHRRCW